MTTAAVETIEYLLTTIGPRITAAGAGFADARPLAAWRKGESTPRPLPWARLSLLEDVTREITRDYTGAVVAAFLRGSNPELDGESPLLLIRGADNLTALGEARDRIDGAVRALMD